VAAVVISDLPPSPLSFGVTSRFRAVNGFVNLYHIEDMALQRVLARLLARLPLAAASHHLPHPPTDDRMIDGSLIVFMSSCDFSSLVLLSLIY